MYRILHELYVSRWEPIKHTLLIFPKILCLFGETKNTGLPEGKVPMFYIPDPALHKRGYFFACIPLHQSTPPLYIEDFG